MKQQAIAQRDLFDTVAQIDQPWSAETQVAIIPLLAELMRAVIETIQKETNNEQN